MNRDHTNQKEIIMLDLQYAKLNEELLNVIRNEQYIGSMSHKGSKVIFVYGYSIKFMKFLNNTRYGKCGAYHRLHRYGNGIALCINLKDVPKELLLELANLPHPKGLKHINIIEEKVSANLVPVCKSTYLFKDIHNNFYVLN